MKGIISSETPMQFIPALVDRMQYKMFQGSPSEVNNDMNEWLKVEPICIHHVKQSVLPDYTDRPHVIISIFYTVK